MTQSWHTRWMLGAVAIPVVFYLSRGYYFNCSIAFPQFDASATECATIYGSMYKAQGIYFAGLLAAYMGLYVLVSLNAKKISKREAAIHLIAWTLVPPLWFGYERYFFFQGAAQEAKLLESEKEQKEREHKLQALKEGQDYASKLWGAVLAVLLAFKLGEIVAEKGGSSRSRAHVQADRRSNDSADGPRSKAIKGARVRLNARQ